MNMHTDWKKITDMDLKKYNGKPQTGLICLMAGTSGKLMNNRETNKIHCLQDGTGNCL
jgi:hypothetical protein